MNFLFPAFGFLMVAVMTLILRWACSPGHGSLVRRVNSKPAARDSFGLLAEVCTVRNHSQASALHERLVSSGVRATLARTTSGWSLYVWPQDESVARSLLAHPWRVN